MKHKKMREAMGEKKRGKVKNHRTSAKDSSGYNF